MKNLTDFRKTVETGVDPRACICTEGAAPKVDFALMIIQDGHP